MEKQLKNAEEHYKEIVKSNGITDPISEVVISGSGLEGENFASTTECATIKFQNPGKKPLHLFTKRKPNNDEYCKWLDDAHLFLKEVEFCTKYFLEAESLCKAKGQEKLMDIYPKCYHGDGDIVVFENLVLEKGYVLLDKKAMQDFDAASLALTNLGKHHGIAHAVIAEHGGSEAFFQKFPSLKFNMFKSESTEGVWRPFVENPLPANIKILGKCVVEGKNEAIQFLESKVGKVYSEEMVPSISETKGFQVLNHGDFWNNNMMFKKENNKIVSHIAIDFQIVCYGSPSVDLAYFLFTSVKPNIRRSQLNELFQVYLNALNETAESLGHPIGLTLQELKSNFSKYFLYGYWNGMAMSIGAGFDRLEELDINQSGGLTEIMGKMDSSINKWIDDNADKLEECAKEIVEFVREYKKIKSGIF